MPPSDGMEGIPPLPFIFFIFFIILRISPNCLSSLLTSCTRVPLPAAMRLRRLPLMIVMSARYFGVIARMIASS